MKKSLSTQANFTTQALSLVDKTEREVLVEKLEDFRESCLIEAEAEIAMLESDIKRKNGEKKQLERTLAVAEKDLHNKKFSIHKDYGDYLIVTNDYENKIGEIKHKLDCIDKDIANLTSVIAKHQENFTFFS